MKPVSDTLFQLIHSMSQTEKTYFKRQSQGYKGEENNVQYLRVFDAINAMKTYDETKLIASFEGERFIKNFSEIKKYLKNKILKVLRSYYTSQSIEFEIYEHLSNIEILKKKGLNKAALAELKRTRKIAQKYDLFDVLLNLRTKELAIKSAQGNSRDGMSGYVNTGYSEDLELLKQMRNVIFHRQRYYQIHLSRMEKGALQPTDNFEFDEKEYPYTAFDAARFYYASQLSNGHRDADPYQMYLCSKKAVEIFVNRPQLIKLQPIGYCSFLFQYASACRLVGKKPTYTSEADEAILFGIKELNRLYKKNQIARQFWIERSTHFYVERLVLHIQHEEIANLDKMYHKAIGFMTKYQSELNYQFHLFNISALMMTEVILEDWEMAIVHYQQFNQYRVADMRTDTDAVVRMYAMIVYYELGNLELVDNLLSAAYQFLRKKGILFEFEKLFFSWFKKLIYCIDNKEKKTAFQQFKSDMKVLFEQKPEEAIILTYFDFETWVESCMQDCSMLVLMQQNRKKLKQTTT